MAVIPTLSSSLVGQSTATAMHEVEHASPEAPGTITQRRLILQLLEGDRSRRFDARSLYS